jgi:cell division septal protein FtsQ
LLARGQGDHRHRRTAALTECQELTRRKSKRPTEAFICIALFWLFFVLVLSAAVLVLVIDPQGILNLRFGNTIESHCHPR